MRAARRQVGTSAVVALVVSSVLAIGIGPAPAFVGTANAATVTVDDDGPSDFDTIQAAVGAATSGDTIVVNPGTYPEEVAVDKPLTIRGDPGELTAGAGPDAPTMVGGGTGVAFRLTSDADGTTVSGFDVRQYDHGLKINLQEGETLRNVEFSQNSIDTVTNDGIRINAAASGVDLEILIEGNDLRGLDDDGIDLNFASGSRYDVTIRHNVIDGSANPYGDEGIDLNSIGGAEMSVTVEHNEIVNMPDVGVQVASGEDASNIVLRRNVIAGNQDGGIENNDDAMIDARYNYWGTSEGPSTETTATNALFEPYLTSPPDAGSVPIASTGGPNFQVVEASVDDAAVTVGEPVDVTLVVENRGSMDGTYHALLTTMNDVHYSERVEIAAGESHTFTPEVTFAETGTYNLRINYRTLATIEVDQRPPDPLEGDDIDLVDAYSTRSTVWNGESYDVVAVVRNVGDETGQVTLEYNDGTSIGSSAAAASNMSVNESSNTSANTSSNETNETPAATETEILEAGETAAVRHTITVDDDRTESTTVAWTVGATAGGNATDAGTVTVLPADEVESGVVDAYTTSATVRTGENYSVTAVVHNGNDRVQLFTVYAAAEGGADGGFRMVWVDPGETIEVHRTSTAPDETGSLDWTVNGIRTSVTVATNGTGDTH